uniref:Uncharacterized protein n=1 Tax=Ciona intestinalis TaxID=7719 RepID=F7A5X4_CIOIN
MFLLHWDWTSWHHHKLCTCHVTKILLWFCVTICLLSPICTSWFSTIGTTVVVATTTTLSTSSTKTIASASSVTITSTTTATTTGHSCYSKYNVN